MLLPRTTEEQTSGYMYGPVIVKTDEVLKQPVRSACGSRQESQMGIIKFGVDLKNRDLGMTLIKVK